MCCALMRKTTRNWYYWKITMTTGFTNTIKDVLQSIKNPPALPEHVLLISSISTIHDGIGLQHPHTLVIPNFYADSSYNLKFTTKDVWLNTTMPLIDLPHYITILCKIWHTHPSKPSQSSETTSNHTNVCVNSEIVDRINCFLAQYSLNTCLEKLKAKAVRCTKVNLEQVLTHDKAPWIK